MDLGRPGGRFMHYLEFHDPLLRGIAFGSLFSLPCWILLIAVVYAWL